MNLKAFLLLLFALIRISISFAQSIISNGDAETYYDVPAVVGHFDQCIGWDNCSSPHASPDYWHLDGTGAAELPFGTILMDSMMPHGGKGVLGQVIYTVPTPNNNFTFFREYLDREFDSPMIIDSTYEISIWYHSYHPSISECDCFSMLFSTSPLIQNFTDPIIANPQITVTNSVVAYNWTYWSGTFKADSAYTHITLGNFFTNVDSQLFPTNTPDAFYPGVYYTFDDLYIGLPTKVPNVPDYESIILPNVFTPNDDGVNDKLTYQLPSTCKDIEFSILNRWGNRIYSANSNLISWNGYIGDELVGDGVYFWILRFVDEKGNNHTKNGFIQMLGK